MVFVGPMSNEKYLEIQDSVTPEESVETPKNDDQPKEDLSSFDEKVKALEEKNKELLARTKKAEEKFKKLRDAMQEDVEKKEEEAPPKEKPSTEFVTRDELTKDRLLRDGIDQSTVNLIETYAKGAGKPIEAILQEEAVSELMKSSKAKGRLNEAVPAPSSRSAVVEGKTFAEMSIEERRKNFEKIMNRK